MPQLGAYTSKADNKKKDAKKKAAKKKAKKVVKAKKMLTKAEKLGTKSLTGQLSLKRKKQIKGQAQATTAANRAKAATAMIKSGGQGSFPKKRKMKVTPRSIRKTDEARSADLRGQKRTATGKRYKRSR